MKQIILSFFGMAFTASTVFAHPHVSVAVVPAQSGGNKLAITFYGDATLSISNGQFLQNGTPWITPLATGPIVGGTFNGYIGGAAFTLTTDFPAAQAALAGADVWYELAGVSPVAGLGLPGNVIAYSIPADNAESPPVLYQDAFTNGATPADRSLVYGVNNHFHGVTLYSLLPGTYDLSIVARDHNALLGASDPVTVRVMAVPEPGMGLLVVLLVLRRRDGGKEGMRQ